MNEKPRIVAVIPARMGSTRFPGKPLALIQGRPMIEHVYHRTAMCDLVDEVLIATCDTEIQEATRRFGGQAVMTSAKHERASDRVAEVATAVPAGIYVMVQGDEPMIQPMMVESSLRPMLDDKQVICTNLYAPIADEVEFESRDTIKVVMDQNHDALYFSREPVPTRRLSPFDPTRSFKQVCVIPFRRDFLLRYVALSPTPLEIAESIDMLRALEHGYKVRMVLSGYPTHAVDTPADIHRVSSLLASDPLTSRY